MLIRAAATSLIAFLGDGILSALLVRLGFQDDGPDPVSILIAAYAGGAAVAVPVVALVHVWVRILDRYGID